MMKKAFLTILLLSIIAILTIIPLPNSHAYTTTQLTNNAYIDWKPQINASGYVVWEGLVGGTNPEIFLYNGSTITNLSNSEYDDYHPQINVNGHVVWYGWDDTDSEIYLYDGSTITNLSNNDSSDKNPDINASGYVVWLRYPIIYLYDGSPTPTIISTNAHWNTSPQINANGDVVWQGWDGTDWEIYLYDGSPTPINISNNADDDSAPQININGDVVWLGWDGTDRVIYLYDGSPTPTILSNNADDEASPQINANGHVVWQEPTTYSGVNILIINYGKNLILYDGTNTTTLTESAYYDSVPQINVNGHVVWSGWNDEDWNIILYDGLTTTTLSDNDAANYDPQINATGDVVWRGWGGTLYDIFLATIIEDSDGDDIPDSEDACPNEDATGFDIDGDGCIDNMSGLGEMLEALVTEGIIAEELQNSLLSKVENAEKSADKDNICAAVNKLEALINEINAQRGKKISNEAADLIVDYANSVITWLLDQLPPDESC